jgi:hypothetical protein
MYKIAEATSDTAFATIEATTRFSKIGDRGELAIDGSAGIPARVESVAGFLRVIFVFESCVDIADEV